MAGSGIETCAPRMCDEHVYRESVPLGQTLLSPAVVRGVLERLALQWRAERYNLISYNCCHFANHLACELNVSQIPAWVTDLSERASMVKHGISAVASSVNAAVSNVASSITDTADTFTASVNAAVDAVTSSIGSLPLQVSSSVSASIDAMMCDGRRSPSSSRSPFRSPSIKKKGKAKTSAFARNNPEAIQWFARSFATNLVGPMAGSLASA